MKKGLTRVLIGENFTQPIYFSIIYAVFRFYCGISIAIGAGFSKVFHLIDEDAGHEWSNLAFGVPQWFIDQVAEIGFNFISPTLWAYLAVYGEFIGGLLIAVGLFTRISAFQLAFQFFVVSFIWYEEPELFGMYYQQLIFWSFVLISVTGGGRFSLDNLLFRNQAVRVNPKIAVGLLWFFLIPFGGMAQSDDNAARIRFTISNPGLASKNIDLRFFNPSTGKWMGYGYQLGPFASHAVNMPAGTRVFEKRHGGFQLLAIIAETDEGRSFRIGKIYPVKDADRHQAGYLETNETKERESSPVDSSLSQTMVNFMVAGKSLLPFQSYVRVQLPGYSDKTNVGFSKKLSWFSRHEVSFPVGTKVYLCKGAYWRQEVEETYLFTVDTKTANSLIRL